MQNSLKLSVSVLFAAGTITLVNVSPAQACTGAGNNMPGGGISTFGAYTIGTSYDAGNGFCFKLNSFNGISSADQLRVESTIDGIGLTSGKPAPGFVGTPSLSYTFSRFLPDPSNLYLREYTGGVLTSASAVTNPSAATMNFNAASGPSIQAKAFVVNIPPPLNVTSNPNYIYPSPYIRSETFTASMNVTAGWMTNFSTNTNWAPPPPAPGPLPLLGAGVAFGFSRKLRSRIKLSA